MKYRLKENCETFTEVDGRFEGRKYEHGRSYDVSEIPSYLTDKFEEVRKPEVTPTPAVEDGEKEDYEIMESY